MANPDLAREETADGRPWLVVKTLTDALGRDDEEWVAEALERYLRTTTVHDGGPPTNDGRLDDEAMVECIERAILAHERSVEDLEAARAALRDGD